MSRLRGIFCFIAISPALIFAYLSIWLAAHWALSRFPELPPSSGVVPLSHLFIAAYVIVTVFYFFYLSTVLAQIQETVMRGSTLLFTCL